MTPSQPLKAARRPGRSSRSTRTMASRAVERPQVRVLGVVGGAAGGAPDGVAAGEEELDDPGPDEAPGAGDAHEDGHGRTPADRSHAQRGGG